MEFERKREMKDMLVVFLLVTFLTMLSFVFVAIEVTVQGTLLMILLLAFIQLFFQLAYFMHMKHRGHIWAIYSIVFGVFVAATIIIGFSLML